VNEYRRMFNEVRRSLGNKDLTPSKRRDLNKEWPYLERLSTFMGGCSCSRRRSFRRSSFPATPPTEVASLNPVIATIHKSQGSEYPAVIIPVLTQHYAMLQRNLLYTGVTRGKRLVVLVGQKKAVAIAVRNTSGRRRWSKLGEWLRPSLPLSRG
jgi:UvrD-like helicase C-terminal domain